MAEFIEYTEPVWRGLNMRALQVDEAYLVLQNLYNNTIYLYGLTEKCYSCCYSKVKALKPDDGNGEQQGGLMARQLDNVLNLNVDHAVKLKIFAKNMGKYAFDNQTSLCDLYRKDMREFGVYNLTVRENGTCAFVADKEGVDVNLSLLSVFLLVALTLAILKISWCAWRTYRYDEESVESTEVPTPPRINRQTRMRSIDAVRGIAIVLMIFVNSGGGEYWWMEHAPWNGLHVADVVFPIFLWIMGVCIPISVKVQMARGAPKGKIIFGIVIRSLKLFVIGLFLNSINGPQLEQLRIMGVLQRLGIAYLVCGVVHTIFTKQEEIPPQVPWKRSIQEILILKGEFLVMLILIGIHLGFVFGLAVPSCPRGYLGPGGKSENAAHPQCIGGAVGYIDLQVLGNSHIYQHPTAKHIYDSSAFDPEGIFGCLLSAVHGFLGCLAGVIILANSSWTARITRWMLWSFVLALLGGLLCMFSTEGGVIPINKNLWSLSFVFVTSALGFALLSLLYYVIDEKQWWTGFPFVESGKNSIIMYVGHTIMHKMLPWHWRIGAMNTHFVLLLESTWNTLLWVAIALYLDSIKFYYSV